MRRNCHSEFYLGGGHKYELGSHLHPRRQHFWPFTTLEKNIGGPAAGSGCLRRKLDLVVEKEEHSLVLSSKRIVKLFQKSSFSFLSCLPHFIVIYIQTTLQLQGANTWRATLTLNRILISRIGLSTPMFLRPNLSRPALPPTLTHYRILNSD